MQELEATVHLVADSAQVAMQKVAQDQGKGQSDWSGWSLLDDEDIQELRGRVGSLEM